MLQCSPLGRYLHTEDLRDKECSAIKEADIEESPSKPAVVVAISARGGPAGEAKKRFREMTINTSFDPPTPGLVMRQFKSSTVSTATARRNEEEKLSSYATARAQNSVAHKHFVFSGTLLNTELPTSPNRAQLFAGFLREKIGEPRFEKAKACLFAPASPGRSLQEGLLQIIGQENAQYLPVFKYIVNAQQPNHDFSQATSQRHIRTLSMQPPDISRVRARVPYSTRATQGMAGKTRGKVFVSPANSTATGASSAALSPVGLPFESQRPSK